MSEEDHCVYIKVVDDHILIIVLYVDDMFFMGNKKVMIRELKAYLSGIFDIKDLGSEKYIYGWRLAEIGFIERFG